MNFCRENLYFNVYPQQAPPVSLLSAVPTIYKPNPVHPSLSLKVEVFLLPTEPYISIKIVVLQFFDQQLFVQWLEIETRLRYRLNPQ